MSTFGGKMHEIENISLDQFEGDNLNSCAYFLSHCHIDHMRGLQSEDFKNRLLQQSNVFLYASQVSVAILKNLFPELGVKLKALPLETPTIITVDGENSKNANITVTSIPAGHCPGSIMLLFERGQQRILYTGDFRIKPSDIRKYKPFIDSQGKVLHFDTIYLDTTFFKKNYFKFPKRQQSINTLCNVIQNWISTSPKHFVNIATPARYGSEYLFMEIFNELKQPVHISYSQHEFYSKVPDMDAAITLDGTKTQIHSYCNGWKECLCMQFESNVKIHIKEIIPTAMYWNNRNLENGIIQDFTYQTRVCYSSHASYGEIKELMHILKPDKIEPNVVPQNNEKEKMIMLQEIEDLIKEYSNVQITEDSSKPLEELGQFQICQGKSEECIVLAQDIEEHSLNGFLDSPPPRRRRLK